MNHQAPAIQHTRRRLRTLLAMEGLPTSATTTTTTTPPTTALPPKPCAPRPLKTHLDLLLQRGPHVERLPRVLRRPVARIVQDAQALGAG